MLFHTKSITHFRNLRCVADENLQHTLLVAKISDSTCNIFHYNLMACLSKIFLLWIHIRHKNSYTVVLRCCYLHTLPDNPTTEYNFKQFTYQAATLNSIKKNCAVHLTWRNWRSNEEQSLFYLFRSKLLGAGCPRAPHRAVQMGTSMDNGGRTCRNVSVRRDSSRSSNARYVKHVVGVTASLITGHRMRCKGTKRRFTLLLRYTVSNWIPKLGITTTASCSTPFLRLKTKINRNATNIQCKPERNAALPIKNSNHHFLSHPALRCFTRMRWVWRRGKLLDSCGHSHTYSYSGCFSNPLVISVDCFHLLTEWKFVKAFEV